MRTALLLLFLSFSLLPAAYSAVDSLIEEARFQSQVAGNPEKAAALYERVLADFASDSMAAQLAARGLAFCRRIMGRSADADTLSGLRGPGAAGRPPLLLWRQMYGSGNVTGVAGCGDRLAVITEEGFLFMASPSDGSVAWARRSVSSLMPPAASDGAAVVLGKNGFLYALEGGSGKILWSVRPEGLTSPAALSRRLLYGASGTKIFALSMENGARAWERRLGDGNAVTDAPVVCVNSVIVRRPGSGLTALDGQSGAVLWTSDLEPALPVRAVRDAVIAISGSFAYCLDHATGKMVWNSGLETPVASFCADPDAGIVLLDNAGGVVTLDPQTGGKRSAFMARPGLCMADRGRIFVTDARGWVRCYSADGRGLWKYASGETERMEPVMAGGRLVLLTEASGLFLLDPAYDRAEDARLTAGRQEVEMLIKGGMGRSAEKRISRLLETVSPGDPQLNLDHAILLQKEGRRREAIDAWERYVRYADGADIDRPGVLEGLRGICGASWCAYMEAAGRFNPLYRVGRRIAVLGQGEAAVFDETTGLRQWRYRLRSADMNLQTAAVAGEQLFCFAGEELFCLDLAAQKELWRVRFPYNVTQLAVRENELVAGTWNDGALFLDRASGRVLRRDFRDRKALFPFCVEGRLTLVSLEGVIFRITDKGAVEKRDLGDKISLLPVFTKDYYILQTVQGRVLVFSTETGRSVMDFRAGAPLVSVTADREKLYLLFSNQVCGAVSVPDGRKAWQFKEEGGAYEGMLAGGGRLVLYGGNRVLVCDASSGARTVAVQTVGRISSVLYDSGILTVRSENGLLYQYQLK